MWDVKLAKLLTGSQSGNTGGGAIVGKVVSGTPLKVSIYGGAAILDKHELLACESVMHRTLKFDYELATGVGKTTLNDSPMIMNKLEAKGKGEITYKTPFEKGDELLLVMSADQQTFYIVDRLIKVG